MEVEILPVIHTVNLLLVIRTIPHNKALQRIFPPKFPGEELLGLQNVSPDVLKFGISAGQNMLKQQTDRFLPGFSSFWLSLKYYFSVSRIESPYLFL